MFKQRQTLFSRGIEGNSRRGALSASVTAVALQDPLPRVSYTCNKLYTHAAYFFTSKYTKQAEVGGGKHFPEPADSRRPEDLSTSMTPASQKAAAFMEVLSSALHWIPPGSIQLASTAPWPSASLASPLGPHPDRSNAPP